MFVYILQISGRYHPLARHTSVRNHNQIPAYTNQFKKKSISEYAIQNIILQARYNLKARSILFKKKVAYFLKKKTQTKNNIM